MRFDRSRIMLTEFSTWGRLVKDQEAIAEPEPAAADAALDQREAKGARSTHLDDCRPQRCLRYNNRLNG